MSLILDALRKADAERERGSVPSLHSQPVVSASAATPTAPKSRPTLLWIAIGISVGLLGAAALWVMLARQAPPPSLAPVGAGPVAPAAPATAPAAAPAAGSDAASAAAANQPASVAQPAPWPQPDDRKAPRPEPKGAAPVPVLGNVAPAAVVPRDQLPPDIRAQLPQFAIGGSIYSPVPAARSLIINGQLYRERERLTQDLTLEEIRLKSAVFNFRGHRFELLF